MNHHTATITRLEPGAWPDARCTCDCGQIIESDEDGPTTWRYTDDYGPYHCCGGACTQARIESAREDGLAIIDDRKLCYDCDATSTPSVADSDGHYRCDDCHERSLHSLVGVTT